MFLHARPIRKPLMHSPLDHPLLMDCRRLFLRDYEVWINIGVHDFEKQGEQRVLINVDLYVPLALSTPRADELDEVRRLRLHPPLDHANAWPRATSTCRKRWPTTCWR